MGLIKNITDHKIHGAWFRFTTYDHIKNLLADENVRTISSCILMSHSMCVIGKINARKKCVRYGVNSVKQPAL